jgi:hypothetical protein
MVAITISPVIPRNDTVWATAKGEFTNTFPDPNVTVASLNSPPAEAIHKSAIKKNKPKYTHVEMRARRVLISNCAMAFSMVTMS